MSNNFQREGSEYNPADIEPVWQEFWAKNNTFRASNPGEPGAEKPKFYVLDMFPYPSGAGLHVGHPLGYIASDIYSRYKRHKGFNVLHPMGYDSFGLPAEQYAIQTGQHPSITTEENISRYREQLDKMGFSFDWSRLVKTSDSDYYKWTQWIFIQLFNSWFNPKTSKAESVDLLISSFEKYGSDAIEHETLEKFSAEDWRQFSELKKQEILMQFRIAFLSEAYVNWCPALGTVLANDEVKDGYSERGGHPVERKKMKQWSMRITAYAERLLTGLDTLDWNENLREIQRNWIGKSEGCSIRFKIKGKDNKFIEVFTTRPDTLFGASYMTLAPELDLVSEITTIEQKSKVENYINYAKGRSERDRLTEVKKITGEFTGAYVIHPFSGAELPVWVGEYVLAGYGTGAVMAVPAHDERDHAFAKFFGLPIPQVVEAPEGWDIQTEAWTEKQGKIIHSDFLNGLEVKDAIKRMIAEVEKAGIGKGKTNFRLRDAVFGRQRYWGEPIPIYYKDGIAQPVSEKHLPLELPAIDKFLPTESGEPPLARAGKWNYDPEKGLVENGAGYPLELTTMPGWAGSSWYFFRYMDAGNKNEFANPEAVNYWQQVDFYVGGAEHATGHLLYARFWTQFLYDIGKVKSAEPFKKLLNQGMILGNSAFHYGFDVKYSIRIGNPDTGYSISQINSRIITNFEGDKLFEQDNLYRELKTEKIKSILLKEINSTLQDATINEDPPPSIRTKFRIPTEFINENDNSIDVEKIKKSFGLQYIFDNPKEKFICTREVEKMSKSKWNVVNPDEICSQYGADTLRMYEMFLGPVEDAKPWSTQGIEGVFKFLRKLWRLFHDKSGELNLSNEKASDAELKILHKTIKKITSDIEQLSFNTSVSAFMICVNELQELKCNKSEILIPLMILISPFAPHFAEELWKKTGHKGGISFEKWPQFNEAYLIENSFNYPVSVNGKMRTQLSFALDSHKDEIEKEVLSNEVVQKWTEGKQVKKFIYVPGRIINVVV